MLQIMLCGAHDVGEVSRAFSEVVRDFGAEPWFYQEGKILHINSSTSTWVQNSIATVDRVDVCVFVVLNQYGDITWNRELRRALEVGKPFIVLALQSALTRYNTLLHSLVDTGAVRSEDDRKMVDLFRLISTDFELTVTPFEYATFKDVARGALSALFEEGARMLQARNARGALLQALGSQADLRQSQVSELISLACDDYESDKLARKTAVRRLAAAGVRDEELVLDLARSREQGVQRLAFDLMPQLIPIPISQDLISELATVVSQSDDVGISRRFISFVGEIDPLSLDVVFRAVGVNEEGNRRRAYEAVEQHAVEIREAWGDERLRTFLDECEAKSAGLVRWVVRLRQMRESLGEGDPNNEDGR